MRTVIRTDNAPGAIGPYNQGSIAEGRLLFTAGQIPLDPATGEMAGDTIEAQAEQALRNLQAVVEAAGGSMDSVVKVNVFLKDMNDFATVNGIYARFFPGDAPARAAVEVARLPKDALIEVECVALVS